jgi:hypothetical protein
MNIVSSPFINQLRLVTPEISGQQWWEIEKMFANVFSSNRNPSNRYGSD